jgi:hypothetical protein
MARVVPGAVRPAGFFFGAGVDFFAEAFAVDFFAGAFAVDFFAGAFAVDFFAGAFAVDFFAGAFAVDFFVDFFVRALRAGPVGFFVDAGDAFVERALSVERALGVARPFLAPLFFAAVRGEACFRAARRVPGTVRRPLLLSAMGGTITKKLRGAGQTSPSQRGWGQAGKRKLPTQRDLTVAPELVRFICQSRAIEKAKWRGPHRLPAGDTVAGGGAPARGYVASGPRDRGGMSLKALTAFNISVPLVLGALVGVAAASDLHLELITLVLFWAWAVGTPVAAVWGLVLEHRSTWRPARIVHTIALLIWLAGGAAMFFAPTV